MSLLGPQPRKYTAKVWASLRPRIFRVVPFCWRKQRYSPSVIVLRLCPGQINACFAWNPELNNGQGQLTIYANQDIYPGDEILINYRTKDWAKPKDARQTKLRKHYGFDCACPACQRQPGHQFGAKSDGRRRRMQTLATQIDQDNWNLNTPSGREAKRQNINKLIDNIRQEGLIYPALADALDDLGKLAEEELSFAKDPNAMSASAYARDCYEIALQLAREKLDLDVRCNGSQSPVVTAALKCIRDLDG